MIECFGVFFGAKITCFLSISSNGVGNAVDKLSDRILASLFPDVPREIFLGDDIRRCLRPKFRSFNVFLLEYRLSFSRGDARHPTLPLDLIIGMDALSGKVTIYLQFILALCKKSPLLGLVVQQNIFCGTHTLIIAQKKFATRCG